MVKLIIFECRKHFFKKSILVVLILFSILDIVKIYSVYAENSLLAQKSTPMYYSLYWKMYDDFSGEMSVDKIDRLMEIYKPLEAQTADRTASTAMNNPNAFTGNIYNDYYFFDQCYVKPMKYSYMYKSNANNIVNAALDNITFYKSFGNIYEINKNSKIAKLYSGRMISDFAYTEMYQYYLHYDFSALLVLLICLYGLVNVFVLEKETEMDAVLLTTKAGGTKTVLAKILSSALFICVICSLFWLIDFIAFSSFFGSFEGSTSPVYALQNFEYASINMNLGQYALLSAIVKTGGILVVGMGFLLISCLFKNVLLPFILSLIATSGFIYILKLFMGSGHILCKIINPFILIVNRELFRKTEFLNLFGLPVISFVPALLISFIWCAVFVIGILYLSQRNENSGKGGKVTCEL